MEKAQRDVLEELKTLRIAIDLDTIEMIAYKPDGLYIHLKNGSKIDCGYARGSKLLEKFLDYSNSKSLKRKRESDLECNASLDDGILEISIPKPTPEKEIKQIKLNFK